MLIFTMALEHKHSFHRDMVFDIKDKITKLLEEQENRTIEWEKLFCFLGWQRSQNIE